MHTVIQTPSFDKAAKSAGLGEDDVRDLVLTIAANPTAGDPIPGTGGARKLRIPVDGKGKRGGGRVVTYYAGDEVPVFLLDVYKKGERIDLTQAERNELRTLLASIADEYRRSVREQVKVLKGRAS